MKLDRNINPDGRGKYALVLMRNLPANPDDKAQVLDAMRKLQSFQMLDFGDTEDSEFFLIRLKDKYSAPALFAYADAADDDGQKEWANEVSRLAYTATVHPSQKQPD